MNINRNPQSKDQRLMDLTVKDNYTLAQIENLIRDGASIEAGAGGKSVIFNLCYDNHIEMIKVLIEKYQVDINRCSSFGTTPLFECVISPFFDIETLYYLIEKGADPTVVDYEGESMYDIAQRNPKTKMFLPEIKSLSLGEKTKRSKNMNQNSNEPDSESEIIKRLFETTDKANINIMIDNVRLRALHGAPQTNSKVKLSKANQLHLSGRYLEAYRELISEITIHSTIDMRIALFICDILIDAKLHAQSQEMLSIIERIAKIYGKHELDQMVYRDLILMQKKKIDNMKI